MTGRLRAALLLVAALLICALSLSRSAGSLSALTGERRVSDPEVYDRILARLRAGQDYYVVVGEELRSNGYATVEVFNWRTPLLWTVLATVPSGVRRIALSALAAITFLALTLVARRRSTVAAAATGVAAAGAGVLMTAPGAVGMGESWAGGLVALSLCAYATDRRWGGFSLGVSAMFLRELVAPFALVATLIAASRRRWIEVAAWLAAGLAYGVYYAVHLAYVFAQRSPADAPGAGSWVAGGGLTFLLSTVQWNAWLFFAPWPFVGLCLALIVAGVMNPRCPIHTRWTAGVYSVFFLFIGQHFDRYWGYLTWPSWSLACGFGADGILRACRTLLNRDQPPG